MRLLGPVSNSGKIALSGTGLTATTDSNYTKLTDDLEKGLLGDVSFSGSLELVNAGKKESTVRAIRTRKEELADNKVSGARDFSGETMNGWLSGEEDKDHGKFADTEDWIKFRYDDSSVYSVLIDDNARQADLKVEVRQGGTLVQEVAWISYNNWFLLDTSTFAADAEYQLRLTVENGKEALAYTFNKS